MDGDIKRRKAEQKTRAKQKSATLSRKSVASGHRSDTPLGKPVRSAESSGINSINPFSPPEHLSKKLRIRHMLLFGAIAMLLFGASMFLLGMSIESDSNLPTNTTVQTKPISDSPKCEVIWQKDSPANSPQFALEFDRELPNGFRTQFIANRVLISPEGGVYTLSADEPTEYLVKVVQESDVATDEILCEYGPVLFGLTLNTVDS